MHAALRGAYRGATALARAIAAVTPPGTSKLQRTFHARRQLASRVAADSKGTRDLARPLLWLHAPSVGEGLQARPVAQAWRTTHPHWQIAYTFFSPSAEQFASSVGADVCSYLPFDTVGDADAMLEALQPSALVFAKLDVWPVLVERATRRGIPVALISATLAPNSGRRGWWSRQLLHDAYASLRAVGAIDAAHATRLRELGVSGDAMRVTGDTRFDQVAERALSVNRESTMLRALASSRPTLVAGSTWPSDEAVLFPAWDSLLSELSASTNATPRMILAPHEPSEAHCSTVEQWAARSQRNVVRLSELEVSPAERAQSADLILVDRVGVLGELYALADIALVGGGFHRAGLHSVIEPAAFGAPVLFGPGHDMSREAGLLLDARGARAVSDVRELAGQLRHWFTDIGERDRAGIAARAVVEQERGATARTMGLIEELVGITR